MADNAAIVLHARRPKFLAQSSQRNPQILNVLLLAIAPDMRDDLFVNQHGVNVSHKVLQHAEFHSRKFDFFVFKPGLARCCIEFQGAVDDFLIGHFMRGGEAS